MGTVSIFLEVYDGVAEWPELNRIICAWREAEENTRKACGLPSVATHYDGCPRYGSIRSRRTSSLRSNDYNKTSYADSIFEPDKTINDEPAISAYDIMMENLYQESIGNTSYEPKIIKLDGHTTEPDPEFDWESFLEKRNTIEYERQQRSNTTRHLVDAEDWFNYFPMTKVKTEYYFRYSGTQTSPPCYGVKTDGRKQTNHWRVFKDPIQIAKRQLLELNRLLKERIAPSGSPVNSCLPDTASVPDPADPERVMVSRPLQSTHKAHFITFCECINWKSKFIEDQLHCSRFKNDQNGRFYNHPYNFDTVGF